MSLFFKNTDTTSQSLQTAVKTLNCGEDISLSCCGWPAQGKTYFPLPQLLPNQKF